MKGLDEGSARAATLLVAFDRLVADSLPARLANVEIDDVRRIVQALPRAMKCWTWDDAPKSPRSVLGRWDIENEYHVQNMLWAILAPLFPDLDDEEYLKSLGQLQPCCDLAIFRHLHQSAPPIGPRHSDRRGKDGPFATSSNTTDGARSC